MYLWLYDNMRYFNILCMWAASHHTDLLRVDLMLETIMTRLLWRLQFRYMQHVSQVGAFIS